MELPASYRKIIDPLIATARGFLEAGQSLVPFAFVGSFSADQAIPIRINTRDNESKDQSAHAIQTAAAEISADYIFTIMEAWGLPKDKLHQHQEILDRYGAIAKCPYKIDTVSFVLETRHGIWTAQLLITAKGSSKRKRTFGAVTLQFVDGAEGRFAGLLLVPDDAPSGGSPLH
jgi:hypothetical protein